jgi:hypothetical protein
VSGFPVRRGECEKKTENNRRGIRKRRIKAEDGIWPVQQGIGKRRSG